MLKVDYEKWSKEVNASNEKLTEECLALTAERDLLRKVVSNFLNTSSKPICDRSNCKIESGCGSPACIELHIKQVREVE